MDHRNSAPREATLQQDLQGGQRMTEQQDGIFPAVCPLDCPDTCGLLLHKEKGKIIKVTGNPDHPITKGAICNKVRNMTERVYDPDRVLYPLKRIGPKGEGKFERISWEEAVNTITGRFKELIRTDGPESILPYSFYGNMGVLSVDGMDRRFFNALGSSQLDQTICSVAGNEGWASVMGFKGGTSPEDTEDADLIIVWGGNVISTNMHQVVLAEKARKKVLRWSLLTFIVTGRRNGGLVHSVISGDGYSARAGCYECTVRSRTDGRRIFTSLHSRS